MSDDIKNYENDDLDLLFENFPFLTYALYNESEYIGIVQNMDNYFISMYVYNIIPSQEYRKYFLELGNTWWWESNRQIPINIFLKGKFDVFKPFLKTFVKKEFYIYRGPTISLQNLTNKKQKKKNIQILKSDKSNHDN